MTINIILKVTIPAASKYTGYDEDGGYTEYVLVRDDFAYKIPQELSDVQAVPLLCAGIIGYRALHRANLPNGGNLGIYGLGSSAHIIMQLAQQPPRNASIFVVTRDNKHRQLGKELGAKWVDSAKDHAPPELLDSAILFSPNGSQVPEILQNLRKGGTLAVAGIHLSEIKPQLDYQKHLFFEKDLRSVTSNTREDGYNLFKEICACPDHIKIHHKIYPLEEANQALIDLKQDRIQGTGILQVS